MSCARQKPAAIPQKGRREYLSTGYHGLKRAVSRGGLAVIDGRSQAGRAIAQDRAELVAHVGGEPSATQERGVDAVLMLDLLIGAGVAALQAIGPIDRRRHAYRPLARELAGLIEKRHRILADLGWERRACQTDPWQDALRKYRDPEGDSPSVGSVVAPGGSS